MAVIVDPPSVPAHGRLWSHLVSDQSLEELHAFAERLGVPARGFDRDHYDIPEELYQRALFLGAEAVSSRELVTRLMRGGLRRPKPHTLAPRRPGRQLLRPPRLREGDLVAVVTPAGPVEEARLSAGVGVLESWGLRVEAVALPAAGLGWLAGSDRDRAEQLTGAWLHPDVRAVWAARGGYGTQRLLDVLDWDLLAQATPRLLVGFSDLTALHQAVAARLGVVTVHGAGVAGLGEDADAAEATRRMVMDRSPALLQGRRLAGAGVVEGVLVGGNVAVLAGGAGTTWVRPAAGGIAMLEDVGERPYRLDRALTQLLRSGWFDGVGAVALGSFTDCGTPEEVEALVLDRLGPLGVPILAGLPFGHGQPNLPIPLGVRALLDTDDATLAIPPAVR